MKDAILIGSGILNIWMLLVWLMQRGIIDQLEAENIMLKAAHAAFKTTISIITKDQSID